MSEPSGFGEFSTVTSGTERKRGFVGILPFRNVYYSMKAKKLELSIKCNIINLRKICLNIGRVF